MRRVKSSAVAAVLALVGLASSARADIVFTGTNGSNLSASVTFAIDGNNLVITLTNTSLSDVMTSSQVLTAVFFSTPGSLTPVSANVAAGSDVNNPTDAGDDEFPSVGGEWAYKSGLNIGGSSSGISSSGLDDLFGSGDAYFGDVDLDPPQSPNGISYGITSAGDDPTTANGGLVDEALIQNSVVFTLSGWNSNWSLSDITNVWFQYGTSLDEPNLAVPEPGVIALLTVGLIGFAFAARKMSWA
jgi:hypothetical protein